jgi:hypothetical protein
VRASPVRLQRRLRAKRLDPGVTARLRSSLALAIVLVVAGCGGGNRGEPAGPPLPTPVASLTAEMAGTIALLRNALAASGYRLDPPRVPYRPSEPARLSEAPRTVVQVSSADPDEGFVVVYQLLNEDAAGNAARDLATHLGSGFGQTNFPLDAQFSVAQVGSTVIFTWVSRERAADPDAAQGAFDVIRTVGREVPVLK